MEPSKEKSATEGNTAPVSNLPSANSVENQSREPYGYQWPASRLSRYEMGKLTVVSKLVNRPLNQLIKEAVDCYADQLLAELRSNEPSRKQD